MPSLQSTSSSRVRLKATGELAPPASQRSQTVTTIPVANAPSPAARNAAGTISWDRDPTSELVWKLEILMRTYQVWSGTLSQLGSMGLRKRRARAGALGRLSHQRPIGHGAWGGRARRRDALDLLESETPWRCE